MTLFAWLSTAGHGQTLAVIGSCPEITWSAAALTPGGTIVLISSLKTGNAALPAGSCAGTPTRLGPLDKTWTFSADAEGRLHRPATAAGGECGAVYQLLDVTTCRVTNPVQIDRDEGVFAGSFTVASGPPWSKVTTPLSCLDVCALRFGGAPADYWCSTHPYLVDHLAYLDGWGDDRLCREPQPEDHAVGVTTRCAGEGCYASAWVDDHGCEATNYCWLR